MAKSVIQALAMYVLLLVVACTNCPTPEPPGACLKPNPTIKRAKTGFAVTPDSTIAGDSMVVISVKDAQNVALSRDTIAPTTTKFFSLVGPRPLQLHFLYLSADGDTLADDMLRVDDSEINTGGITAVDIVIGHSAPNPPVGSPPTCPTVSNQPLVTGTTSVDFAWAPGEWFQVHVLHGSVTQKFGILTKAATVSGFPGSATVYRSDIYSCLNNPGTTVADDKKSADVETSSSSNLCIVTGTDNNDGQTQRRILLEGPDGCTIIVFK
ncbi:MAG: hypothetical protein SFV22_01845 [Saprospiraceae bacterium]|nr:hypothetical protein [Saprospiraceae bacterium]